VLAQGGAPLRGATCHGAPGEALSKREGRRRSLGRGVLDHLRQHGRRLLREQWEKTTKDWQPSSEAAVLRRLREVFTKSQTATHLFHFWRQVLDRGGLEEYRQTMGVPRTTLTRWVNQLKSAGVGISGEEGALQRLTIGDFPV
jgi:hypothetical protein